jgi:hypothetical protein
MKLEDVIDFVSRIASVAKGGDYEMAHGMEDDLHIEVLTEIAEGHLTAEEMAALAREACKTALIDFPRYSA